VSGGFQCERCGEHHAELPFSYGAEFPDAYYQIPEAERPLRWEGTDEVGSIDGEHFFLRARIRIPVLDADAEFVWGVWVSQSRASMELLAENWDRPGREELEPTFGWLCTRLPLYPETLHLPTMVHQQPVGVRPLVELEETDHPLSVEQHRGITLARVREIAAALLHEEHER
jgi:hypothetical protein